MWKIATCVIFLSSVLVNSQNTDSLTTETTVDETLVTEEYQSKPIVCDFTYNKTSKTFGLPDAQMNVEGGQCLWSIIPPNETTGISLFFHALFLHEKDVVTVFENLDDAKHDNLSIIKPLHADNGSVTVVTTLNHLVIKLTGSDKAYKRIFTVMYKTEVEKDINGTCNFDISANDLQLLYAPIHTKNTTFKCQYTYNHHLGGIPSFIFEEYTFSDPNTFSVTDSSLPATYNKATPIDFFPTGNMKITVAMTMPTNDTYRLRIHPVDENCSRYKVITGSSEPFDSPVEILNNGSIIGECRWIFESKENKMLSVEFKDLHFNHPSDIISINDGASELSTPLLQVTISNKNASTNKLVRTTSKYIWIAFKTATFASKIAGQVVIHEQGGHFKGHGTITATKAVKDDPTFLLEVEPNQVILLNFTNSDIPSPGKLTIYDGFDTSNVLATLHGNIWYPIVSRTSKMLVIGTNFGSSHFTAEFKGVSPDCKHMSTYTNEDYILSGNCNASCLWIIPPQDHPGSVLLLNLQYVSLGKDDQIEINKLDSAQNRIGVVSGNETHVPQLIIPADVGALVEINRGACEKHKDDIVLVGHSSYVPACGKNLTLTPQAAFQITSPLYPDTYPVYASCRWQLSVPKNNLIHLAFNTLKLAPNHCVKVHSGNKTEQFAGSELPDDLFLTGESVVEFNSTDCSKTLVTDTLLSSAGFVVNGTVVDCGEVMSKATSGAFTVPANKSLCIWKVSVPETGSNANNVNIIKYSMSKKDSKENFELHVYDGASIRETIIGNNSLDTDIWSRTNNLIFIYRRIDSAKPSSVLAIKYSTISCNETMQCDNKVCLHPDWRCNGVNDCGDFSDERNCASVPIPPTIKLLGYSSLAFWLTICIMFATGIFCGVVGPFCYQKYKNGQYRRFGDISIIE